MAQMAQPKQAGDVAGSENSNTNTNNGIKSDSKRRMFEYGELEVYGGRKLAIERRAAESSRFGAASECAIFSIGTYNNSLDYWTLQQLRGSNWLLQQMTENLKFKYSMPLQRFSWPLIENQEFPLLCVGSSSAGKTYTHILYIISKVIKSMPKHKLEELLHTDPDEQRSFRPLAELHQNTLFNQQQQQPAKSSERRGQEADEDFVDQSTVDWSKLGDDDDDDQDGKDDGSGDLDVNQFISQPAYIIVSSSQQQAEMVERHYEHVKSCLYGPDRTAGMIKALPPVVKLVSINHDDEKLALRCTAAEVLIASPAALIKCLQMKYVTFRRCKKLIFDDLDLTLQLHNLKLREIMKYHLLDSLEPSAADKKIPNGVKCNGNGGKHVSTIEKETPCRVHMFSRKWTDMVKQVVIQMFPHHRTIIFGNITEASLYVQLKFEVEPCPAGPVNQFKLSKLYQHLDNLLAKNLSRILIVCKDNLGAEKVTGKLKERGYSVEEKIVCDYDTSKPSLRREVKNASKIYVTSDQSLETLLDTDAFMSKMECLIHYSLPQSMDLFDQRFRSLHNHIKEQTKALISIMFVEPSIDQKLAKDLYDLISRSSSTQNSSKLAMKDFINNQQDPICWRWASTGVCRMERLSRLDKFGCYCSDRHYLRPEESQTTYKEVPLGGGQFKITLTYIVNPNEFYFWFESFRNMDTTKAWTPFAKTGRAAMKELQVELNKYRDSPNFSLPLEELVEGRIFGVYLSQEVRVDRIKLLETAVYDIKDKKHPQYYFQYHRQIRVVCIDTGVRISVVAGNIFRLPQELIEKEPMAHRGFHLGFKPTDDEPNWLYKAKKHFYDQVGMNSNAMIDCTVWIRHASENCYWFENMMVGKWLDNLDEIKIVQVQPHKELVDSGFALKVTTEPAGIGPSSRLVTLSKWQVTALDKLVRYAFLRKDKVREKILVMDVEQASLEVKVRPSAYNKILMDLEDTIMQDFKDRKLEPLNYFESGIYCLAKIHPGGKHFESFVINRCRILEVIRKDCNSTSEELYKVECLDHSDLFIVKGEDLYQALETHITRLPFQGIRCQLANLNPQVLADPTLRQAACELIYKYTRNSNDNIVELIGERVVPTVTCNGVNDGDKKKLDQLTLYIPVAHDRYEPLKDLLEEKSELELFVD